MYSNSALTLREIAQDPCDLAYTLCLGDAARSFDPRALCVVQRASLRLRGYTVEAVIIGQSHYVRVLDGTGRAIAVELLACVDVRLCARDVTRHVQVPAVPLSIHEQAADVVMHTLVHREYGRKPGWLLSPPLPGDASIALVESFPGPASPRTIVGVHGGGDSALIRIETIHEYSMPAGVELVRSRTTIAMEAAR